MFIESICKFCSRHIMQETTAPITKWNHTPIFDAPQPKDHEAAPPLYRKKPVEIEAIQFDGYNGWLLDQWSNGRVMSSPVSEPSENNPTGRYLQIKTLEGVMIAIVGDWIIKGVAGEFYPCKPDIFEKTYESI